MPLNFSAAHSSRITKRSQHGKPPFKRSASSPFLSFNQRKPIQRTLSKPEDATGEEDGVFGERLDDIGMVKSLATDLSLRDVCQVIQHIRSHMFDILPENGGFNSTRIAEILNFRNSMPPTVTVAHVHAMTDSATAAEREIAELASAGIIRRTVIPGRGTGGSSVGDGLILMKDLELMTSQASDLKSGTAEQLLTYLRANPVGHTIPSRTFSTSDITLLMRAGFLVASSRLMHSRIALGSPDSASLGSITSISSISKAASGSVAAVGGEGAIHTAGGRGGIRRSSSHFEKSGVEETKQLPFEGEDLTLSLPNIGSYLKLLTSARSHMVSLLLKSRFREMPLYLLRERWDGGISSNDPASRAKKYRGEFAGVLPSKTRKWKQFYGLSFDWVLAECVGAGLMELFETGSVGSAARMI